jgi:hypothetical protein
MRAHGMIQPKTEMPVANHKMLDFPPVVCSRRVIYELSRMVSQFEQQGDHGFLLRLRWAFSSS